MYGFKRMLYNKVCKSLFKNKYKGFLSLMLFIINFYDISCFFNYVMMKKLI